MEHIGTFLFALATALLGGGLMWFHHRRWKQIMDSPLDPKNFDIERLLAGGGENPLETEAGQAAILQNTQDEIRFAYRQYRRRMQTSGMLLPIAVMIAVAGLVQSEIWFLVVLVILMLLIGWLVLLAIADLVATNMHYGAQKQIGTATPLDKKMLDQDESSSTELGSQEDEVESDQ